ncbi:hypothetical protein KCP78_10490 [Salmonella enterica subsp. enterica]|nr:hypothetical protein KCP78_10490 [Salmonella enterica subsp. enterica]
MTWSWQSVRSSTRRAAISLARPFAAFFFVSLSHRILSTSGQTLIYRPIIMQRANLPLLSDDGATFSEKHVCWMRRNISAVW